MINEKILKNALLSEKLSKLTREDRQGLVQELLKTNTQRGLALELGIPHSTLNDWATLRQDNKAGKIHASLSHLFIKIKDIKPEDVKDWGRLEMIKEKCESLLRFKLV